MAALLPDELRGKSSGRYNVGNVSGGGLFWRLGSFGKWRHAAEPEAAAPIGPS